jgi:MoxR-like ATPase
MGRIVDVHFPSIKKRLVEEALRIFFEVREVPGLKKKPSTSELLDWLKLLLNEDIDAGDAARARPAQADPAAARRAAQERAGRAPVRAAGVPEPAGSLSSPLQIQTVIACEAGDPVRRGLSIQSRASLEYWIARSSRAMTSEV